MFVSASYLSIGYGVDEQIAIYFVDREPPADNLYWKDKLLYLRPVPGYLFIPLIVDLVFKAGLNKQLLLSDEFVMTMEEVGHVSALEETGKLSQTEAIIACIEFVKHKVKNQTWFINLQHFLLQKDNNFFSTGATPFKALHRGDLFLFALCVIHVPESLMEELAGIWFALISTLLLLDDAEDIESDRRSGDPNAFLESGLSAKGIEDILRLVSSNLRKISIYNKIMADKIDSQFKELIKQPHIFTLLNQV